MILGDVGTASDEPGKESARLPKYQEKTRRTHRSRSRIHEAAMEHGSRNAIHCFEALRRCLHPGRKLECTFARFL